MLLSWAALGACVDDGQPLETPCGPQPLLRCVARAAAPCEPLAAVDPVCEGRDWACPAGSVVRQVVARTDACRPYAAGQPHVLGPLVPVGDRCVMLVDADVTAGGDPGAYRGALLPELPRFGECPQDDLLDGPFVRLEGLPPDTFADLDDVASGPAGTFAVHRVVRREPQALFGVDILGAAVTRVDDAGLRVTADLLFETDGYRSLAFDDGWLYVFDAFGTPQDSLEDVGVLRVRPERALDPLAYAWLALDGALLREVPNPVRAFGAGPQHHVTFEGGRWVMVSVAGFGDRVFMASAASPAGPWSGSQEVVRCALPEDDPDAFCDSVRLVPALRDPWENGRQLVLTYRIDTLAPDGAARKAAHPERYAPVMVWWRRTED